MIPLAHSRVTTALVGLAWCGLLAGASGDDTVVDEQPQPGANVPWMGGMPSVDLGQIFDQQVFQDHAGGMVIQGMDQPAGNGRQQAERNAADVRRRLEPVRRRAEARIDRVDRIVGLSEPQRKKLTVAMESDMRRLAEAITEARGRHVGRTITMDPRNGGFDEAGQQAVNQAQQDGERCRQLLQAAGGPESLLAKVLLGTLDEPQAEKYTAVMHGRATCRWQAVVASGLAQIDDRAGFTQKQHDAVVALLLAEPPAADEESQGPDQAGLPTGMRVAQRLVALDGERLAAILDPRQRRLVAEVATGQMGLDQVGVPMMMQGNGAVMGMGMGGGMFRIEP